jgi:hypothetical protein
MRKAERESLQKKCTLCKYPSNCTQNNCKRSHTEKERQEALRKLKDSTCYSWMRYNECWYGNDCLELHGFKELVNGSPYSCPRPKVIEMTKSPKRWDIFPNGNILIQYDDELCLFDPSGNNLLKAETQFDIFHIINNQKILFSRGNILTIANLKNIDGKLDIEFIYNKEIENNLKYDYFRILPNGNIFVINGKNLEIVDQNLSTIKKINISSTSMNDSNENVNYRYEIYVARNKIFISTPFKITYMYDFELNLLGSIDDYFKENTIIENGDSIYFLWYDDRYGDNITVGSFKFSEYSNNMKEKEIKKLKYKITKMFTGTNNQYFIGKSGATLIFYSTNDLNIVGYCQISDPKEGKIMIKNDNIYYFHKTKIEIYSINYKLI